MALRFLSVLLIAVLFWPDVGQSMQIRIKEECVVEGENVLLGDIADLQGARGLEHIFIARSPYPKETREITIDLIKTRLKQANVKEELDLLGPQAVKVTRAYKTISPEEIRQLVEDEMKFRMKGAQLIAVKAVSLPAPIVVPTGPLSHIVELPNLGGFRGQMPISVLFYQGDTFRKKVSITAQVSVFGQVLVSNGVYERGKVLEEGNLDLATRDLNEVPKDAVRVPEEAIGKVLKRSIGIGEVIRSSMLEEPTLIKRGQMVTIVLENERLKITALGSAQENGALGDIIKVANVDSKKVIQARIVGKDTVKVEF